MRLREGWTSARASVVAQGGITEANQFDVLVNQLTLAKTLKEFCGRSDADSQQRGFAGDRIHPR
jgi:hypothetical protein